MHHSRSRRAIATAGRSAPLLLAGGLAGALACAAACSGDPPPTTTAGDAAADAVDAVDAAAAAATTTIAGCGATSLLAWADASGAAVTPAADDPRLLRGPWPVGARTLSIAGLTVEAWYPAAPGSDAGKPPVAYDLRAWLPAAERDKIPDAEAPTLPCACARDLQPDGSHGPYPVMVFIHGTAGFRAQSVSIAAAWASHGFVVLAADHPRIVLADMLQLRLGADQKGDARAILAAVRAKDPALGPLAAVIDPARLAVSGHSAGGMATGALADEAGVAVLIPMAARGVAPPAAATATSASVILGGLDDATIPWGQTEQGYASTAGSKRLIGLAKAGHLAFSDLCVVGGGVGGLMGIAERYELTLPPGTAGLFEKLATDGCKPGQLAPLRGWQLTVAATLATLRQRLHCRAEAAAGFAALQGAADVGAWAADE